MADGWVSPWLPRPLQDWLICCETVVGSVACEGEGPCGTTMGWDRNMWFCRGYNNIQPEDERCAESAVFFANQIAGL